MEWIMRVNDFVGDLVWGPFMLAVLVGTGIYFTVRTGLFQLTYIRQIFKNTLGKLFSKKERSKNGVTPFQAVSTALAGTMGVGNIAGVGTALASGGPGALFWMWVSAFFGMMTKYAEVVLSMVYQTTDEKGNKIGGPMYYISRGLGWKWMGAVFSVLCAVAAFGIGNMTQSNAISENFSAVFHVDPLISGIVLALGAGLVILGGIKRIASFTSKLVPFMSVLYFLMTITIVVMNIGQIPAAFGTIFEGAFSLEAAGGGALGYVMMLALRYGFSRGVFSNEAGLGSAPIAHGAADCKEPVEQGMWGVMEVFLDTIVICTLTGLSILVTDSFQTGLDGAEFISLAFKTTFREFGAYLLAIAIGVFAFSTIVGWAYYGEQSIRFLVKRRAAVMVYKFIFIALIVVGATMKLDDVWSISDTFNGLMSIPNLLGLILLSGVVIKQTKEYKHRRNVKSR